MIGQQLQFIYSHVPSNVYEAAHLTMISWASYEFFCRIYLSVVCSLRNFINFLILVLLQM